MLRARSHRWIAATVCLAAAGCTPCDLVFRTIRWEPSAYWWKSDSERSRDTYRIWANEAWEQEGQGGCPGANADYEAGFKDGFVDFVFAGGTGEPPPLPPRTFWNMDLRLPAGRERADQWFAGYREGARVARDSGYRALAVVQTSLTQPPYPPPYGSSADESYPPASMSGPEFPQPEEMPVPPSGPADQAASTPPGATPKSQPSTSPPSSQPVSPVQAPASSSQPSQEPSSSPSIPPAPKQIELPNFEQSPAAPLKPSAARSNPLRLTGSPEFEW
jgi:hypothetical protein